MRGISPKISQNAGVSNPVKFSPQYLGRKRSILLDGNDTSQNVLTNRNLLKHHKQNDPASCSGENKQQMMSDEEFTWWSNPFLRMLSSPLRSCVLTKRHAPKDYLIRLTATVLPQPDKPISSSTPAYITPTDLHHPRYAGRPDGLGVYIACSRGSVPLLSKGRHRGMFPGAEIHKLIGDQIVAGLQARCAEEAELLTTRIRSSRIRQDMPVVLAVRRLTTTEYQLVSSEGTISDPNISAVLVVPKSDELFEPGPLRKTRLLLHKPSSSGRSPHFSSKLPPHLVPMFFEPMLIQDLTLRARFRKALDQALSAERNALRKVRPHISEVQAFADLPYEPKARDAYALCASRGVDVVPLVIALRRLSMWEGGSEL